ncbi:MAG: 16S rRNA (guanine(966)-N(2))-methyltransferase RsmD [Synechococcales bacterium]|nr:16S rRNA (guanine(966)-N(2))-methyltransferase RsmD [Synechococcales bacterium]
MALRIYGNRQLKTLPGRDTRPTPARVREALFNIWQGEIQGCRWLDLCTGTGAMGAEALCRGAASAMGIEQSGRACGVIQQNWQQVARADQQFQVMRGDVLHLLPRLAGQQFDRIYFDPPYASDLYEPVLAAIAQHQLLAPDGELAVEHDRGRSLPHRCDRGEEPACKSRSTLDTFPLEICREKIYGTTAVTFYCHSL